MRRSRRALLVLAVLAATVAVVLPRLDRSEPDEQPTALPEGAVDVRRTDAGAVRSLATDPGRPIRLSSTRPEAAADEFVDRFGHLLGPGELVATSSTPRIDGGVALRFRQEVDGIPVFGGEASVQVAPDGGVLSSLADLSTDVPGTSSQVLVDAAQAQAAARQSVADAQGLAAGDLTAGEAEQWWYDPTTIGAPAPVGPRLTWRVEVEDASGSVRRLVLVDTRTGTVDLDLDLIGEIVNRKVCDAQGIPHADPPPTCTTPVRDEGAGPIGDVEVDRVYDVLGQWHAFLADGFGWESQFPDAATVRYCKTTEPCPYRNAFWSETQAVFGEGFAVDDVIAHEMTHGLTAQTAALVFAYQSGAINESMSDVFGELIDQANGSDDTAANRWLIGEDLAGGPLRDLADPEAFGDPASMTSPSYAPGPDDAGGTHTNSGVGNLAAALLVDGGTANGHTVRAIGADDTAALWFTVLSDVLLSGSDYADLAVALRDTCRGLIGTEGITAGDCTQVDEAVAAVEMDDVPPAAPATEAPVCAAGQTADDLFTDGFEGPVYDRWTKETVAGWHWPYPPAASFRYASEEDNNLWGPNTGTPASNTTTGNKPYGDARLAMAGAPIALPTDAPVYLRFSQAYAFHTDEGDTHDGGVVEIQVDGGPAWLPLTTFTDNGYSGSITGAPGTTNPLGGRAAFVGDSPGYLSSRADLSGWAGHDVKIRFRLTEDATGGDLGWYVDDVRLYACPPSGPQLTVTQAFADDRVVAGQPLHLAVTVTNTGTDPLTGLTVDTPEVPSCTGVVADLDPGEHQTLECDHDTVAPDDVGTFTSTASADAAEILNGVQAEDVEATLLDPAAASLEVTQATEQDTVIVGDDVDLGVTVRNTGAVPLTNVAVDSSVDDCDGTVPALAVDATDTIECVHTTVDPTDIGMFSPTATATADQVVDPVPASAIEVRVLAPDREDPTVTVTTPEQGAVYNQGQDVLADYACADDSGYAQCTGTVPDGQAIDTSAVGTQFFSVTATDLDGNETTSGLRTYTVANRRPDARIRAGATGPTAGDGRYNLTGAGQNRTVRVAKGRQTTFFVTVQNDGSHAEQLAVRGQPGTTNYGVRYFTGGADITATVRTGAYRTPNLGPGATRTIKVVVTVGARAPVGSRVDRLVTVTSANDSSRKDVVRFIVRRR